MVAEVREASSSCDRFLFRGVAVEGRGASSSCDRVRFSF